MDYLTHLKKLSNTPQQTQAKDKDKRVSISPQTKISLKVFIYYRREDSRYITGRIYDTLLKHLLEISIYKDVDSILLE